MTLTATHSDRPRDAAIQTDRRHRTTLTANKDQRPDLAEGAVIHGKEVMSR